MCREDNSNIYILTRKILTIKRKYDTKQENEIKCLKKTIWKITFPCSTIFCWRDRGWGSYLNFPFKYNFNPSSRWSLELSRNWGNLYFRLPWLQTTSSRCRITGVWRRLINIRGGGSWTVNTPCSEVRLFWCWAKRCQIYYSSKWFQTLSCYFFQNSFFRL